MASSGKRSLLKDTWFLEILSIIVSFLSFGVVVILLAHFNHKPIFTWHGVSLNTWVSVFSTIAKSLLLFTVSACLSQWTYISFSQGRRRLMDFDRFASASRGPNGSLSFLWHINIRSLASIGAFITILSLAIDPFVQQIIGIEERQLSTLNNATSIARALRYSKGSQILIDAFQFERFGNKYEAISSTPDFSMQSAILFGLSNSQTSISQQTAAHCPGAHCEWEPYDSLAVCSQCTDISDKLVATTTNYTQDNLYQYQAEDFNSANPGLSAMIGEVTSFGFPNGLHMDNDSGAAGYNVSLVSYATSNRTATVTFRDNGLLLYSLTMIIRPATITDPKNPFTAMECGLTYCVKNYNSSILNGTLIETSTPLPLPQSPWSRKPNSSSPDPYPEKLDVSVDYPRSDLQLGDRFNISQVAINGIGTGISSVFTVSQNGMNLTGTGATGFYMSGSNGKQPQYQPNSMQALFMSGMGGLNDTFEGLAMSMSNTMRSNDDNNTLVIGTTGITVYNVRWKWITLPFISAFGGFVFLGLAIMFSHMQHIAIWKSSAFPIMKFGPRAESILGAESLIGGMEKKAKQAHISLFEDEKYANEEDEAIRGLRSTETFEMQIPSKPVERPSMHTRQMSSSSTLPPQFMEERDQDVRGNFI